MSIELEYLSPGAYNVREGGNGDADARMLGTVRKIGCNWYAIRRGNRIGSGGNIRARAVDILSAFAAPSASAAATTAAIANDDDDVAGVPV